MDLGSIFLGLGLALVVAAILAGPVLARATAPDIGQDSQLSTLQAERDRILTRLQELDMDAAMGKVLQEDFERERGMLMGQGAEVLRAIDSYNPLQEGVPVDAELDAKIEAAIAGVRGQGEAAAGFCPACGKPVQLGDQFCTHCGALIQHEEARS